MCEVCTLHTARFMKRWAREFQSVFFYSCLLLTGENEGLRRDFTIRFWHQKWLPAQHLPGDFIPGPSKF